MNLEIKIDLLKKVYIFSEVSEKHLKEILIHCKEKRVTKGEIIVSENELGDSMYLILEGEVKVSLMSEEGKEIILSTLRKGDCFGEMSLLDGEPRSANVIALTDTELLELSRESFLNEIVSNKHIAGAILKVLSMRLREANERILGLMSKDVFDRLAEYFQKEASVKGRELIDGSVVFERLPQSEIASIVGSSRETVTRAIKEMVDKGMIIASGKQIILKKNFQNLLIKRHKERYG
ncbi:CRP/FNR family transcriptional regulator, anaerobic regulatory protein [Thermotomaculum hydrothermale]|uniref:CRP/FNR family transcriptional regulator, anaerobic regulatory protein n=1 Tax=Thermotomaculum hydrothermale TaxID=981385 RepID=A0A7R6PWX7_9BACT|nr:Crp/Fnr family transcriptional regulator [Thermotomaculum hydrothermale]BBB32165.1 CRP/FNR family transcriptional regulator, anaerobic regulatory protein [Thermotomaculum hydrothermale]